MMAGERTHCVLLLKLSGVYRQIPNLITIARLLLTVVFFALLHTNDRENFKQAMWIAFAVFVVAALTDTLVVSVHQSHAYLDGACLYFTFAGRPDGDPTPYYRSAWDAATREVLACGGALSHHHGVGRNRARFVADALGSGFHVLTSLKATLDPLGIMNPGALGLGSPSW